MSAQPSRACGPYASRSGRRPRAASRLPHGAALLPLLASLWPAVAPAAELQPFGLCRPELSARPSVPVLDPALTGVTVLTADEAYTDEHEVVTMTGAVEAVRDGQSLQADHAVYERRSSRVQAEGNVRYLREGLLIDGERGELHLDSESGQVEAASFRLFDRHARGSAGSARFLDRDVTVLRDARYTTCDPGQEDWLLRSGRVRLDRDSGMGTARNVSLSFMGVPFLYTPWLSFPIDDRRKSGFLAPGIRDSSRNGIELSVPYYLNLAPRYDATLAPRLMSRRGAMLESEFRYLNPGSEGRISASYLADDRLSDSERSLLGYRHASHPGAGLKFDVDYNRVSDAEYFRDFGSDLSIASITHLEQRAVASYQAETWTASARLQRYQTIDETIAPNRRPYRQLPVLTFRSQLPEYNFRPNYRLVGGYTDFRHDSRIEGRRLELQPSLTFPMYTLAAYLQPTVTLRHTRYELGEEGAAGTDPSRTLPVFTVDTGVFLERDTSWGGQPMIHTLEPRLYYLYAPYRDQDDLPLFDTGLPDFNFTQLFRDNRFNGADRVGDANQVTAALVTRLIDARTGRERMQAGIGQIRYFQDREVRLSGDPGTARVSDLVAEANAVIAPGVTARLDARRSEESGRIDRAGVSLQYRPAPRSIVNVGYRFRDDILEQTDLTLLWPLGPRWHAVARHNYSLHDRRTLETLAGVEYRSCCWRARIVNRRYLDSVAGVAEAEYNRSIYFQLEFIGLTSLGDDLESLLERGILGD